MVRKVQTCASQETHQFACTASFATSKKLACHRVAKHFMRSTEPNFECTLCDLPFSTFNRLSYHKRVPHGCNPRNSSENVDLNSFQYPDPQFLWDLRYVQHFLVDSKMEFRKKTVYISRLTEYSPTFINEKLTESFNELNCAVKINLSLGFVLHDLVETQDYRYFYPADNNPLFQLSLTLVNEDLGQQIEDQNRPERLIQPMCISSSKLQMEILRVN